jgi:hypothetical protein
MHLVFYIFVVLGILFYIYLIPAYIINKKRDRMIDDMQKAYTKQKFKKCPHCSVLNPLDARVCQFCNKELPAPPEPPSPAPEAEQVRDLQPAVAATSDKTISPGHPAEKSPQAQLESFPYCRVWPIPNSTALITMTSVFLLVIFIYGFVAGIYSLGKQGVRQLDEVTREAAKRQAQREASYAQPSAPSQPQSTAPMQVGTHTTPTPVPTPTPLSVSGTEEEQISRLMLYLESGDWNVASQAKRLLIGKGGKAVPALALEINNPDPMVRTHVITALGEIASAESIPALIGALSQDDPVTAIQAATALGGIPGEGVIAALSNALKHEDWRIRQAAVLSLGNLKDAGALPALLALKDDPNEAVQKAVQKAVSDLQQISKKE